MEMAVLESDSSLAITAATLVRNRVSKEFDLWKEAVHKLAASFDPVDIAEARAIRVAIDRLRHEKSADWWVNHSPTLGSYIKVSAMAARAKATQALEPA